MSKIETNPNQAKKHNNSINNFKCAYTHIWPIEKLNPHPENTNEHPVEQVDLLAKIIRYQGQRLAIKVSKQSGFITAGHCRLSALKKEGWTEVAVDLQDYEDKAQEIADLNADNKVAELAHFNDEAMRASVRKLNLGQDFDLDVFGIVDFKLESVVPDIKNTSSELDLGNFQKFDHECPKCGFEWNEDA